MNKIFHCKYLYIFISLRSRRYLRVWPGGREDGRGIESNTCSVLFCFEKRPKKVWACNIACKQIACKF